MLIEKHFDFQFDWIAALSLALPSLPISATEANHYTSSWSFFLIRWLAGWLIDGWVHGLAWMAVEWLSKNFIVKLGIPFANLFPDSAHKSCDDWRSSYSPAPHRRIMWGCQLDAILRPPSDSIFKYHTPALMQSIAKGIKMQGKQDTTFIFFVVISSAVIGGTNASWRLVLVSFQSIFFLFRNRVSPLSIASGL